MLEAIKNEHYYAGRLKMLADDMEFIASLKGKSSEVEAEYTQTMHQAVECCKKALIKDLDDVIGFLS